MCTFKKYSKEQEQNLAWFVFMLSFMRIKKYMQEPIYLIIIINRFGNSFSKCSYWVFTNFYKIDR